MCYSYSKENKWIGIIVDIYFYNYSTFNKIRKELAT